MGKILGILIFLVTILLGILAVQKHPHHSVTHKVKKIKVHEYVVKRGDTALFYYIMDALNDNCFFYESTTPVTDFSKVSFTRASTPPEAIKGIEGKVQEVEEQEIPNEVEENLSEEEISNEIETVESENAVESEASETGESDASGDAGSDAGDAGGDGGGDGGGGGGDGGGGE